MAVCGEPRVTSCTSAETKCDFPLPGGPKRYKSTGTWSNFPVRKASAISRIARNALRFSGRETNPDSVFGPFMARPYSTPGVRDRKGHGDEHNSLLVNKI